MNRKQQLTTKKIAVMALLIALQIVLSRFLSWNTSNLKIGVAFIPIMVGAYLYGVAGGAIVSGISDLIGALLFPSGEFFPGFTATAILVGMAYGVAFRKKDSFPRIFGAVVFDQLICSLLINTAWICVLYGSPFKVMLISRIPQIILGLIIQPLFAYFFFNKSKIIDKLKL